MKKKKLNIEKLIIFIVIAIAFIIGIILLINFIKKSNSYEYKLEKYGYSKMDSISLVKKLNQNELEYILKIKQDKNIVLFTNEKYCLFKNLDKYLNYYLTHKKTSKSDIVAIINTGSDKDWYENITETDTSKKEKMLVNKYYGLTKEYVPEDIIDIPISYAYENKKISNTAYEPLLEMFNAAKEEGITFVVSSGYRTYEEQEDAYNYWKSSYGVGEADKIAARPGHSDYQTGLSIEINVYGKSLVEDEEKSKEYIWLKENMHYYGFIVRYPKDKEKITGFNSNMWRLRYVGIEVAKYIFYNDITFDEYYAYFLEK